MEDPKVGDSTAGGLNRLQRELWANGGPLQTSGFNGIGKTSSAPAPDVPQCKAAT